MMHKRGPITVIQESLEHDGKPHFGHSLCHLWTKTWPHTVVFAAASQTHQLNGLPSTFICKGKRFLLRGIQMFGNGHFVMVIRTPNGWMHYDGLKGERRFTFFPLEKWKKAMDNRILDLVTYEVVDENIQQLSKNTGP